MKQARKILTAALIVGFWLLAGGRFGFTQEKPKPVMTATGLVTAKMKYGEGHQKEIDVQGQTVFTVTEVRSDASITGEKADVVIGNLVYSITPQESHRIATLTGVEDKVIPASIGQDKTHAFFVENTACSKIQLEFVPRGSFLGELQFHFDWFVLDLNAERDESLRPFCEWVKLIEERKAVTPELLNRINRMLKEETERKTKL